MRMNKLISLSILLKKELEPDLNLFNSFNSFLKLIKLIIVISIIIMLYFIISIFYKVLPNRKELVNKHSSNLLIKFRSQRRTVLCEWKKCRIMM